MSKELFVSSTPRETKVAVVEEDQLAEVYFERENEYTLAGSIYKGQVTRVLPGMQSAFVNIGLERDAFLYVSDFLLQEDEDAEVLEHVTARGPQVVHEVEHHAEQEHPVEASEMLPVTDAIDSAPHLEGESGTAAAPHANPDEDREGARRWRGRRRRGRGRDRFAERPERPERPEPQQREQRTPESVPPVPHPEASQYPPMVLPGESISKYQPQAAVQPSPSQEPPAPQSKVRASTEYSLDSAQFLPDSMVLPGESLSKYRNQSPPAQAEAQAKVEPEMNIAGSAVPALQPVLEEASIPEKADQIAVARKVLSEGMDVSDHNEAGEPDLGAGSVIAQSAEEAMVSHEPEAPLQRHEPEQTMEAANAMVQKGTAWQGAAAGIVEEEEIEEEESDFPEFDDEHLDLADYEELEEEELAPVDDQLVPMGSEITEAVRDAHVLEQATGRYEAEGLDSGEDEDEEDVASEIHAHMDAEGEMEEDETAEEVEFSEESGQLEGARAEARGPAGTAGYQQRTERRQDRRGAPGRGGRRPRGRSRNQVQRQFPAISDVLKEGQEILVQIAKEPIAKKGARITSHIALPGRFLVYMPTVHHTGVSRKIASEEERHRLKRIVLSERGEAHGGFIVRTAAAGANEEDLRADIRFLINLWNEIRGRADKSKAPALIYHDLNLVERILRDQVTTTFSSIWVDTEHEYERVLRFVSRFQPSLVKRVKLYTKETPLFEQFNISEEINKALKSKVWLKSGGYIVINQTEALVAIDVNTGKYVGKTARLEDTIVKTNIDAIREIVRQIRLRDLGGIIVIDFIDMDERKNRQKVMQALEEALKADRAPSKVLQFNDFGLVAITRKRVKQSLERTLGQQCSVCTGTGMVKSVTTVCNEIYMEMRKMSRHFEHDVVLRVNPEVAKALKANNARWLQDMEELTKRTILIKSDALLHPEQFDMQ
jgi:ribonuclease E